MILYHGSNVVVKEPEIRIYNRYLDFGYGFYTTSNYEQAKNFAEKVAKRKGGKAIVNIYEYNDETFCEYLKIKIFDSTNEEWLDFVSDNRNGTLKDSKYDIVIGPVADDDVYKTLHIYNDGLVTKEQALEALKVKKLYNQYVFLSTRALLFLKFIKSEEI